MYTPFSFIKGTTAQIAAFTGAVGNVIYNITKKTLVVQDGSTVGGIELLRADMANAVNGAAILATLDRTGTLGQILKAQGVGNPPIWTASVTGALIGIQVIASTAAYIPTPGTNSIIVDSAGGAAGGAGAPAGFAGAAGGAGSFARVRLTTGFSGVTATVGAAGTAGAATAGAVSGNGGTSTFGSLITCPGGIGTSNVTSSTAANVALGGVGGALPTVSSGITLLSMRGGYGGFGMGGSNQVLGGYGGSNPIGTGGGASNGTGSTANAGVDGQGFGGGGGGGAAGGSASGVLGGKGAPGGFIIYEFA